MIIELYGLSGSGKTYSTPLVAAQYGLPVADVSRRAERYKHFLFFCSCHPTLAAALLLETLATTGLRPLLLIYKLKMFVASLAKVQKASSLGGGIVDAGLFQFLLVIYEDTVTALELTKFKNMLTLGDYRILIFDVEEKTRLDRMRRRGRPPRTQFGKEYQQRWYDIYLKNDKVVREFVTRHFEVLHYRN